MVPYATPNANQRPIMVQHMMCYMFNDDWMTPTLMASQINIELAQAFDQAPMAMMRPPQMVQDLKP